jgi:hypothetical protein
LLRLVLIATLSAGFAAGHDIPADVRAQVLVGHSDGRLDVLVRVPLAAMRDIEFPQTPEGYLDIKALTPKLPDTVKLWIAQPMEVYENGRKLRPPEIRGAHVSLLGDSSFGSLRGALFRMTVPTLSNLERVTFSQVWLDTHLSYPIVGGKLELRPGLEHLAARVNVALRYWPPDGSSDRLYELHGDPGLVPLDPSGWDAARRFVVLGFEHILDGVDHLLFVLCLVIPVRRVKPLVVLVTSFTAAHSVTLACAALGYGPDALWFPPLVELLIAASIVYMAIDNLLGIAPLEGRWVVAFGFGLVHGFGFSFALRDSLQFAGAHIWPALAAFNVGVELGQLAALAGMVPSVWLLYRYGVSEKLGSLVLTVLVAHTAWHWMTERWDTLERYRLPRWELLGYLLAGLLLLVAMGRAFPAALRSTGADAGRQSPESP